MKHLFIILLIATSIFTKASYANDGISAKIRESFENIFGKSTPVRWTRVNQLYKADINIGGQNLSIYFNEDGESVATGKYITAENLPKVLQENLRQKVAGFKILEIFEVSDDKSSTYYASVENNQTRVILSSSKTNWSVYKKKTK